MNPMKTQMNKMFFIMLVALLPLAFTSCEVDGPMAHYKVVVNDRLDYLPHESVLELNALNEELASVPFDKDDAIGRFNKYCNNLQNYFDENRGQLIWDDLNIELCLYNTTSGKGVGEGQLVKSRIITYRCE